MSFPDQIVKKIYGDQLKRKDKRGNIHHLYTLYQDKNTKEQYFLRTVDLPASLRISDGISELVAKKYHNILAPVKITPLERTFQTCSYLLRAPNNIILLTSLLQIKQQCSEVIQIEFFIRFIQFLLNSYKILEQNSLPLFGMSQLGINDLGQFTICDPSVYFRSDQTNLNRISFGEWIASIIKTFLRLPLNKEEQDQCLIQTFGNNFNHIKSLIHYLLTEKATLEMVSLKIMPSSRISEDATTITSSYVDINEVFEKNVKNSTSKQKSSFSQIGKFGRMIIVFIIIGVVVGGVWFIFQSFEKKMICQQGSFLSPETNSCLNCSDGCLRCQDTQPNRCIKCNINMYLVLDDVEDKQGYCLKQCRGKLINIDVCIRQQVKIKSSLKDDMRLGQQ